MYLYLFRHGDAEANAPSDDARPLNERGREQSRLMAEWLHKRDPNIRMILSSPLIRALQTSEIIASVYGEKTKLVPVLALTPGNVLKDVLPLLSRLGDMRAILVGHIPDLGLLLSGLVWGEPSTEIPLKKSGIAFVRLSEIRYGKGTLEWIVSPDLFGF